MFRVTAYGSTVYVYDMCNFHCVLSLDVAYATVCRTLVRHVYISTISRGIVTIAEIKHGEQLTTTKNLRIKEVDNYGKNI